MQKVKSSIIYKVGYENGNLIVQFTSLSMYKYFKVPKRTYTYFLKAKSKGRYFLKYVKYTYEFIFLGMGGK